MNVSVRNFLAKNFAVTKKKRTFARTECLKWFPLITPAARLFHRWGIFLCYLPIYPEIRVLWRLRDKHVKLSPKTI